MNDCSAQSEIFDLPATGIQQRNMLADWMFYDVGGLSRAELALFAEQVYPEEAILVVEPSTGSSGNRIRNFSTFESFAERILAFDRDLGGPRRAAWVSPMRCSRWPLRRTPSILNARAILG